MAAGQRNSWWRKFWPLGLLCCGLASRWMLSEAEPSSASTAASLAAASILAALVCAALAWRARLAPPPARAWGGLALGGACLLAGPQVGLLATAAGGLSASSVAMALALTPACVAVAGAAFAGRAGEVSSGTWPGLAGVAALLLVLPEPSLANVPSDLLLFAAPVLTGLGAAWICARRRSVDAALWSAAIAFGGAGVAFGCMLAQRWFATGGAGSGFSVLAIAVETPLLLLTLFALFRGAATRWSAQFVVVPLIVVSEGFILAQAGLTWRSVLALALLGAASLALLFPPAGEPHSDVDPTGTLGLR